MIYPLGTAPLLSVDQLLAALLKGSSPLTCSPSAFTLMTCPSPAQHPLASPGQAELAIWTQGSAPKLMHLQEQHSSVTVLCLAGPGRASDPSLHPAGMGSGLVFLNNLAQLVPSLGGAPNSQTVFVSLFSVCNCVGRLVLG